MREWNFIRTVFLLHLLSNKASASFSVSECSLKCENDGTHSTKQPVLPVTGRPGKAGPPGPKGDQGQKGEQGRAGQPGTNCVCSSQEDLIERVQTLEDSLVRLGRSSRKDCLELQFHGLSSGKHVIYRSIDNGLEVYCDQETDGGGWIVIQRRMDGSENFYRNWDDYVTGFGNLEGEMWLGLKNIYKLTEYQNYELLVNLEDFSGARVFAKYRTFHLSDSTDGYRITVGGYSGNAGDSLAYHNGQQFSTKDGHGGNSVCATQHRGAWWYNACHRSHLNGIYNGSESKAYGVSWLSWGNTHRSLKKAEMKIRRK